MSLMRCHTCGKSFESSLKKGERCPLCDGWAGQELGRDLHPETEAVRDSTPPRQSRDHP